MPTAPLTNVDGSLYGTACQGGALGYGTVFKFDRAAGRETVLHSFSRNEGCPSAALLNVGGFLYGTTHGGPIISSSYGYGTVFRINPNTGAEAILHTFFGGSDGAQPSAALINVAGTLYGTTKWGGTLGSNFGFGFGTVFKIDPATGAEVVLHSFDGSDGAYPAAALLNVGGMLYGTTLTGGTTAHGAAPGYGTGTVFKINPATGTETVVYVFDGADGAGPAAPLINIGGILYGTTASGGAADRGTVFRLTR
jgi:uncharacterized repeat protein (TIGR03803 family)